MAVDWMWEMKPQFTEERREDKLKRWREHKGKSVYDSEREEDVRSNLKQH